MDSHPNTTDGNWFPLGAESNDGWRVDAATLALLAIIGDPRPEELTRAITATRLVMLPRLVPAMQLLNAARPASVPQTKAIFSEVYGPTPTEVSRNESIRYFVNALHALDSIPECGFRVLELGVVSDGKPGFRTSTR